MLYSAWCAVVKKKMQEPVEILKELTLATSLHPSTPRISAAERREAHNREKERKNPHISLRNLSQAAGTI
jgi:hypothetical protein